MNKNQIVNNLSHVMGLVAGAKMDSIDKDIISNHLASIFADIVSMPTSVSIQLDFDDSQVFVINSDTGLIESSAIIKADTVKIQVDANLDTGNYNFIQLDTSDVDNMESNIGERILEDLARL